MLKSIDVLLGLALVMLVASMAVTVLTQMWSTVRNMRGEHLRDGLAALLRQIHEAIPEAEAHAIAAEVLRHPLVRGAGGQLGSLVHRDEFTSVLLEIAAGHGAAKLPELARKALIELLAANGIDDPAAKLAKIRECALALERAHPELAAHARQDAAILESAASDFVAKINARFERSMDRVSARFTLSTRQVTLVNALIVALAVQLDAAGMLNRLAADDALRAALVQQAVAKQTVSAGSVAEIESLAQNRILASPAEWLADWRWSKLPGILLSALLLSLGAPFWFEALKDLLRLKEIRST